MREVRWATARSRLRLPGEEGDMATAEEDLVSLVSTPTGRENDKRILDNPVLNSQEMQEKTRTSSTRSPDRSS